MKLRYPGPLNPLLQEAQQAWGDPEHLSIKDSWASDREGKVLRVLPSGRWVPRNQGLINFWEMDPESLKKSYTQEIKGKEALRIIEKIH